VNHNDRGMRILRFYPQQWRMRYGEEMAALLGDCFPEGVPIRVRIALAWSGVAQRARGIGFSGTATSQGDRLRAGSLAVLCGWSMFIVAGGLFAKYTEHWAVTTPRSSRILPSVAYAVVQWTGLGGILLVVACALAVLPSARRLIRDGGWPAVRQPVLQAVSMGAVVMTMTVAVAIWSRHLGFRDRNGGLVSYGLAVALWAVAIVIALVLATAAAVVVARHLQLTTRQLHGLSIVAVILTSMMTVITLGTVAWWASTAVNDPQFLHGGLGSGLISLGGALPLVLVVAGALMLTGLCLAVLGTRRVSHAWWVHE
jgi:hypothetical protein